MILFLFFIFGLVIGSFLNVCIYRIPKGRSIVSPPSSCVSCGTLLQPMDLFPVISWAVLGGKCRYCGESIDLRYPLVEILTGLLYAVTYWRIGLVWALIPHIILITILITITFIDLDHQMIPNTINLFALVVFLGSNLTLGYIDWRDAIIGGLVGGGFLFLLVLFSRGAAMGMGDVKLMAVLGLFLGWRSILLTLLLSFILGGLFGVLLLLLKRKGRKDAIPFGPWIALAVIVTILYGNEILTWYIQFL